MFTEMPHKYLFPPNATAVPNSSVWNAFDSKNSRSLFLYYMSRFGWIITDGVIMPKLKVDGKELSLFPGMVNGSAAWGDTGFGVFYALGEFVAFSLARWPQEVYNQITHKWEGNAFWSGSLPDFGAKSNFRPRGSLRNDGTPIEVEWVLPHYVRDDGSSDSILGEYKPVDGAMGDPIIVGLPQFVDQHGRKYVRSLERVGYYFTYGGIRLKFVPSLGVSMMVLGNPDSINGWWQAAEVPSIDYPVIFRFTLPPGVSEPEDIESKHLQIEFDKYVVGDNLRRVWTGEHRVCRL